MTNKMYGHFDDAAREYVITDSAVSPATAIMACRWIMEEGIFISTMAEQYGTPASNPARRRSTSTNAATA